MTYLIVAVVVIMVVGPILWALPSRRERELAALREDARKRGFTLQVTEVDHPAPTAEQQVSASGTVRRPMRACVAYRLVRSAAQASAAQAAAAADADADVDAGVRTLPRTKVHRRDGANDRGLPPGWRVDTGFEGPDESTLALLPALGPDLLAVESTPSSAAFYWTERGGSPRLAELDAALRALMADQRRALHPDAAP